VLAKRTVGQNWQEHFQGTLLTESLCTGQKIEKKLAKETEKGFHRKLPHNQRNPYEPD
jgi:hypothetical protein